MRKYLIPEGGKFYKASLHTHTTQSDGKQTPEQVKAMYKANGYSVLAFTDHEVFIPHNEMTEDDFLILNGIEAAVGSILPGYYKSCDMCLIALDKDIVNHPLWHRTKFRGSGVKDETRAKIKFDESLPDFERVYHVGCVNQMMQTAKEKGFFVIYNHPQSSHEEYTEYAHYYPHAMEMYNHCAVVADGVFEYNGDVYDEMLRTGTRLYCVYTDDSHQVLDACGGWVMIKADSLDYTTVTKALMAGSFYSSMGPEINAIWYEDGAIHITFPRAAKIIMSAVARRRMMLQAPNGDPTAWNEAVFPITGNEIAVRFTLVDENGKTADTNAYFLNDLDPRWGC